MKTRHLCVVLAPLSMAAFADDPIVVECDDSSYATLPGPTATEGEGEGQTEQEAIDAAVQAWADQWMLDHGVDAITCEVDTCTDNHVPPLGLTWSCEGEYDLQFTSQDLTITTRQQLPPADPWWARVSQKEDLDLHLDCFECGDLPPDPIE